MKLPNIKSILITIILLSLFLTPVFAMKTREELVIDEALADKTNIKYSQPTNIYIVPIKLPATVFNDDIKSLYNEIYYYSITRLGYADIPFNYIVDESGNVIEGKYGGLGAIAEIEEDKGGVLIAYISKNTELSNLGSDALKSLISSISYDYGVSKKSISVMSLKAVKKEGNTTKSRLTKLNNPFSDSINNLVNGLKLYEKPNQKLKGEIISINYPKSAKIGEKIQVELIIKNVDKFPWFTNRDYIYVSTLKDRDSKFAVNGEWESFSKPTAISNKTVLPGEQVTLVFQLSAMQLPGKYSEKFVVKRLPNNVLDNTEFQIDFTIDKGNTKLIKVNIPGGFLNVRECPGPGCNPIGRVNHNQILIMKEKSNGWYKIQYSDNKDGWIYGPYVIEL